MHIYNTEYMYSIILRKTVNSLLYVLRDNLLQVNHQPTVSNSKFDKVN